MPLLPLKPGVLTSWESRPIDFIAEGEKVVDNAIIHYFLNNGAGKFSDVDSYLKSRSYDFIDITIKRSLARLTKSGGLAMHAAGRSTSYSLTTFGRLTLNINAKNYCAADPDNRHGQTSYNFDLFTSLPADVFNAEERSKIDSATRTYRQRAEGLSPALHQKELERFIIELSWKSSKIEGNTYTLLDTERLIREGVPSGKNTLAETAMILNHKTAFNEILNDVTGFQTLTLANLERLHAILVKDLGVGTGLRQRSVGITGSVYRPLDNIHQIREAVADLTAAIGRANTGADKALMALLGVSYIQPFEDGNKRTARMMANALLLAHQLAPLSYRSVTEEDYREAVLVFYELNSLVPFKKIFVEQYVFAANNYAVTA
jgi:fido (protein-threonine AMPylation protein)